MSNIINLKIPLKQKNCGSCLYCPSGVYLVATGRLMNFKRHMIKGLANKKVILFSDAGSYEPRTNALLIYRPIFIF